MKLISSLLKTVKRHFRDFILPKTQKPDLLSDFNNLVGKFQTKSTFSSICSPEVYQLIGSFLSNFNPTSDLNVVIDTGYLFDHNCVPHKLMKMRYDSYLKSRYSDTKCVDEKQLILCQQITLNYDLKETKPLSDFPHTQLQFENPAFSTALAVFDHPPLFSAETRPPPNIILSQIESKSYEKCDQIIPSVLLHGLFNYKQTSNFQNDFFSFFKGYLTANQSANLLSNLIVVRELIRLTGFPPDMFRFILNKIKDDMENSHVPNVKLVNILFDIYNKFEKDIYDYHSAFLFTYLNNLKTTLKHCVSCIERHIKLIHLISDERQIMKLLMNICATYVFNTKIQDQLINSFLQHLLNDQVINTLSNSFKKDLSVFKLRPNLSTNNRDKINDMLIEFV